MQRHAHLNAWLTQALTDLNFTPKYTLTAASSDASFRSYWRAELEHTRFIIMDAPPEHEPCKPFVCIANALRKSGVNAPKIFAQDLKQGFLLLEDFGNQTYLDALSPFEGYISFKTPALDLVRALFDDAIDALIQLQTSTAFFPAVSFSAPNDTHQNVGLAPYDEACLRREVELFPEWFAAKHLSRPFTDAQRNIWDESMSWLITQILRQAKVPVHRDFIVRNLMVTSEKNPAVLDFQDALFGPISYDIASFSRDAFIEFDDELVLDVVVRYWEKARARGLSVPETIDEFWRDVEWMAVQRHLKVAGIFARLNYRDGKSKYLAEIPRFIQYLLKTCNRYDELRPLGMLIRDIVNIETQAGYTF